MRFEEKIIQQRWFYQNNINVSLFLDFEPAIENLILSNRGRNLWGTYQIFAERDLAKAICI